MRRLRVLEVSLQHRMAMSLIDCGYTVVGSWTAVPTLLLLDRLFASLVSESGMGREIHLQDYNRAVLEFVTFPNVLLK